MTSGTTGTVSEDHGGDFLIPLPDAYPEWGLAKTAWSPRRALMIGPRCNAYPDYWRWYDPQGPQDKAWQRELSALSLPFLDSLRSLGLTTEDVVAIANEDSLDERTTGYRWPRELTWASLPVVGPARFAIEDVASIDVLGSDGWMSRKWNGKSPVARQATLAALGAAEFIILDNPDPPEELMAELGRLLALSPPRDRPATLLWFDGSVFHDLDRERVEAARKAWEAHDRFVWCHSLNARVLLGRALADVYRRHPSSIAEQQTRRMSRALGRWFFFDVRWRPATIQTLFHIAGLTVRLGNPPASRAPGEHSGWRYRENDAAVASGLAERLDAHTSRSLWRGTGRYPAAFGPVLAIDRGIDLSALLKNGVPKHVGASCYRRMEDYVLGELGSLDLIERSSQGFLLTELGCRFIDRIGTDLCDPDVLLRWRKPDGRLGGAEDIAEMDDWIRHRFGAVKERVASLPRHLPTSDGMTHWNSEGTNEAPPDPSQRQHLCWVIGRVLNCRDADLEREGFPGDEVAALLRPPVLDVKGPLGALRGPDGNIVVWAGTPLADIPEAEEGRRLLMEAKALAERLPPGIAAWHATSQIGLQPVTWTTAVPLKAKASA